MAVFDAVFWEQKASDSLFRLFQSYGFRVYRVKPPIGEKLLEFFELHTAGVVVTDRWNEIERMPPRVREPFVIAVIDGAEDDVWTADLILKRGDLNGILPRPLVKRLTSFVMKARKLIELTYVSTEDDFEIMEVLSQEELTLYELLSTHQEGVSSKQISAWLGWPSSKIRVYIYRLRNKLEQFGIEIIREGRFYKVKEVALP